MDTDATGQLSLIKRVRTEKHKTYDVKFTPNLLTDSFPELQSRLNGRDGLLVTTPTVAKLYGNQLSEALSRKELSYPCVIVRGGEAAKTLDTVKYICSAFSQHDLQRDAVLISLGGGVCSDLVTVSASLFRRGIDVLRIPTTLVGQIDAAIGVKGGVNFDSKKNSLGCFYPPEAVLIDHSMLLTLGGRQLRCGMAEIVKMAVVCDASLFTQLESYAETLSSGSFNPLSGEFENITRRAICGMLDQLEPNIYEDQSYERLVDFGHSFSPALEQASQFSMGHGEAVAIDMAYTSAIGVEMGILPTDQFARILRLLRRFGLPLFTKLLTEDLQNRSVIEQCRHRGGHPNLVVPTDIGQATFVRSSSDLTPRLLHQAHCRLRAACSEESLHRSQRVFSGVSARSNLVLVYDIGGTNIRAGLFDPQTKALTQTIRSRTPSFETMPRASTSDIYLALLAELKKMSSNLLGSAKATSVSVAFPGPLDASNHVIAAPTIWRDSSEPPINMLQDLNSMWPDADIALLNDVSAAGYRFVADENFCIVAVGSGIGNKVFIKGAPITGVNGRGGEIGHARVDFSTDALRCDCGGIGHLGSISSGRGTLRKARVLAQKFPEEFSASLASRGTDGDAEKLTSAALVNAFHNNDPWAVRVVEEAAMPLGSMLGTLYQALGLERFVIVGGFAQALGRRYHKCLVATAAAASWETKNNWKQMIEVVDDDDSGLIGAGIALSSGDWNSANTVCEVVVDEKESAPTRPAVSQ